jgi:LmbE family N-acetylglucosaminyl deacetylase
MNRDRIREWRAVMDDAAPDTAATRDDPEFDQVGTPDAAITTAVDVTAALDAKRAAMEAHASQINEDSWFLRLPPDVFRLAFGTEWYVRTRPPFGGDPPADREAWILKG